METDGRGELLTMLYRSGLSMVLALGLCGSIASGQEIRPLVREGQPIPGLGGVQDVSALAINDAGTWIAEVDTDFPATNEDGALLRNGLVHVREGVELAQPSDAVLNGFEDVSLTGAGDTGLVLRLLASGAIQKSGVFWNLVPVAVMGDSFDQPGIAPNSVWNNLSHVKLNSRRQVLVFGSLITPPSSSTKHTLARYLLDETGAVTSIEVLASRGLPMAVLGGDNLNVMPTNSGATCQNERGDFLCVVDGTMGAPAILLDMETVLAQEGFPSPVKGLNWKYLDRLPRTSINDFGDYVFTGKTEHLDPLEDGFLHDRQERRGVREAGRRRRELLGRADGQGQRDAGPRHEQRRCLLALEEPGRDRVRPDAQLRADRAG
jgi:hypothetical protein